MKNPSQQQLLFATEAYIPLQERLARLGSYEVGEIERSAFPDGERYLRLRTSPIQREVVLLGGTISDADTLELYDLAWGLCRQGARRLTLLLPYFAYSTMERATRAGEVVTAKSRAYLLSSLPRAPEGNRVMLVDLHTEGIPHYFEGSMIPVHLYANEEVIAAALRLGGKDFVLASTDAGRAKWVQSLTNDLNQLEGVQVEAAFLSKRRLRGERTEVRSVNAAVEGKKVVIYDDMIRSGSSLINAARAYKQNGATALAAIATHGIFPGNALEKIEQSGLFEQIVCTDSHPRVRSLQNEFLQIISLDKLFHRALSSSTLLPTEG